MKSVHPLLTRLGLFLFCLLFFLSCKKSYNDRWEETDVMADKVYGHLTQTKTYSSEVVREWIKFDLRLLRTNATLLNNFVMMQHWAYSSIALYEAVVPGMPAYQTLSGQLNQMPAMPRVAPGQAYHWPSAANAVMAATVRYYYPGLPAADKVSTDSLEAALNARYRQEVNAITFERSVAFGKEVASRVYEWSKTDGSLTVHPTYNLPVGPGMWVRTPPGFSAPQNPYWGTNRPLMPGSIDASHLPPPPAFSTDPSSEFYARAKEVYDASKSLTAEQKAMAIFWRDVPGGGHAHWMSIFLNVLYEEGSEVMLDRAAMVYAKLGITQSDARISCWKSKYAYTLLRPITYINTHIAPGTNWNSYITTPNHPEYPSAHGTFSGAAADIMTWEFGENYAFADDTYNFLSLPARHFTSFWDAAIDAGDSRVYAGLHYWFSVDAGNRQGSAIARYLKDHIQFKKGE